MTEPTKLKTPDEWCHYATRHRAAGVSWSDIIAKVQRNAALHHLEAARNATCGFCRTGEEHFTDLKTNEDACDALLIREQIRKAKGA